MESNPLAVASELGRPWEQMSRAERDRATILAFASPKWNHRTSVQYIITGRPSPIEFPAPVGAITRFFRRLFPMLTPSQQEALARLKRSRIQTELGLERAALLPAHVEAIDEIAKTIARGTGCAAPLTDATETELQRIRPLLNKLPATAAVARYRTLVAPVRHRL